MKLMSLWQFLFRSLAFHWRMHLAVALGVAAATAVLTGALLVGDSVRGSLRHLALDRLGKIEQILVTDTSSASRWRPSGRGSTSRRPFSFPR